MALFLFVIAGVSGSGKENTTLAAGTGQATAASVDPAEPPAEVRLAFGQPYAWDDQEITLSPPVPHEEDNPYLGPEEGNRYITFDVTVRNISARDFDAAATEITAALGGRMGSENYLASDTYPQTRIPPGAG